MPANLPLWATLFGILVTAVVSPVLVQAVPAWLHRRQTDAETRQAAAAAALSDAQTLNARFKFYGDQITMLLGRITALEMRQEQLQAEVDDWKAAVAEEPEPVQRRIRSRLRTRVHGAGGALIIESEQTTIEGGIAGGDIGTATIGSVTTPERIPPP